MWAASWTDSRSPERMQRKLNSPVYQVQLEYVMVEQWATRQKIFCLWKRNILSPCHLVQF